ncbi:MAG: hypothetical protein KC502_11410 [Myxococcales bacterium]|nr:hypothetical protein [Myxococcales bacterium]
MFDVPALQVAVYPLGLLYLLLHAGPLFRHRYEPSIRGGTDWRFFASEIVVFTSYVLFAPAIVDHTIGKIALVTHLTLHVSFTILDYIAHDFLLNTALTPRAHSLLMWAAKEGGLALDTATHAIAVTLLVLALPLVVTVGLMPLSIAAFFFISSGYMRRFGPSSRADMTVNL